MKFKSQKDILFLSTVIISIGLFIGIILARGFTMGWNDYHFQWVDLPLLLLCIFLVWVTLGTKYELTQTDLKYKSGPINGKIEIQKITEIIKGKTLWSGFKPATARKGLIIKYERYNEIYISPKTNDSFIKKILELNNKIEITE